MENTQPFSKRLKDNSDKLSILFSMFKNPEVDKNSKDFLAYKDAITTEFKSLMKESQILCKAEKLSSPHCMWLNPVS